MNKHIHKPPSIIVLIWIGRTEMVINVPWTWSRHGHWLCVLYMLTVTVNYWRRKTRSPLGTQDRLGGRVGGKKQKRKKEKSEKREGWRKEKEGRNERRKGRRKERRNERRMKEWRNEETKEGKKQILLTYFSEQQFHSTHVHENRALTFFVGLLVCFEVRSHSTILADQKHYVDHDGLNLTEIPLPLPLIC